MNTSIGIVWLNYTQIKSVMVEDWIKSLALRKDGYNDSTSGIVSVSRCDSLTKRSWAVIIGTIKYG